MRRVRLALAQIDTTVGDLSGNLELVRESVTRAREAGADLVAFPELTLPGYAVNDLLLRPSFVDANLEALEALASQTDEMAVVVGFVDRGPSDLYNAAAVLHNGRIAGVYRKKHLPNYGLFDEARYFAPADGTELIQCAGAWIGLNICEDIWVPGGPVARQAAAGAEILLNMSASPFSRGKARKRHAIFGTRAIDGNAVVATVNLVGAQDEVVYDGNSFVVDTNGRLLAEAPSFEEHLLLCDIDLDRARWARAREPRQRYAPIDDAEVQRVTVSTERAFADAPPLPRPDPVHHDDLAEVYAALVLGVRDYVRKNGFGDVCLGVSGGIDSALAAAIAVDALGAERVHGVMMPSRYTSRASLEDAEALADALGIELRTISIDPTFDVILETLEPSFEGRPEDLTEENIQARIRGLLLMALSNKFGWLVLTAGNKSEAAVGYSTLYGDMAGGFAVLKDVWKTDVFELARWRNGHGRAPLIPERVITRPPSAELRTDQRDEDSLPPYEQLDPILEGYVERDLTAEELIAAGHDEAVVRRVIRLVDRSEYKRRQSPPGVRVSARGFGSDRRYPITARYR